MSSIRQRRQRDAQRLATWVPRLVIALAIVHVVYALATPNAWGEIAADGFVDTIAGRDNLTEAEREADLWFLLAGPSMLAIGTLARFAVRATGTLPTQVGLYLLVIGVPMTVIDPRSGGWLVTALGVFALIAALGRAREPVDRGTDRSR